MTSTNDRRTHARIPLEVPIRAIPSGRAMAIPARSCNLSWGGTSFLTNRRDVVAGDELVLRFPWSHGDHIVVHARVLRVDPAGDDHVLVAARFFDLTMDNHKKLNRLLKLLANGQGSQLAEQLEILCNDDSEMLSMLGEIASGEIEVTALESYVPDQGLLLALAGTHDTRSLKLRARVLERHPVHVAPGQPPAFFQIRLAIEHPIDELRRLADKLAQRIGAPRLADVDAPIRTDPETDADSSSFLSIVASSEANWSEVTSVDRAWVERVKHDRK